ncbi:VOC family protein [Alsobacter sp. SYSU M60028]|uniref:VOC family protein n=1 Tax=Alsobacter ponti TaxID=2962936 RepID=A0ABT1LDR6_9HYPH|nr:VOC family protein [Alsobacter ponti]MCP8939645.1 VOC family protein [Alsobacter ponti]
MSAQSSTAPVHSPRDFGSPVLAAAPHRVGVVTLVVNDLDKVRRFYEETIGLKPLAGPAGGVLLGVDAGPLLALRHEPGARRRSPREAGLFHTAFLMPERADLGAWIAHAAARGWRIHGASDHGVSEALYFADPEGNGIELYVDRPAAAWRGDGPTVRMGTEALDLDSLVEAGRGRRWSGFPAGGTVGHLHLQVGALAPAERFYGELLGFDVSCRYPGATFFGSGGYHHQLAANIWNSRGAEPRADLATGLAGFEILAKDDATVAAARRRLDEAGVATADADGGGFSVTEPWGARVTVRPERDAG